MLRLKIASKTDGLHPSEAVVNIDTRDGSQELVVDRGSVSTNSLPVGWPVGKDGDYLLVELPRQTTTGGWRVWVDKDSLVEEELRANA